MSEYWCFLRAQIRRHPLPRNEATFLKEEEEWFSHIVRHMRGERYLPNLDPHSWSRGADPAGYSLRKISLNDEYQPLTEAEAQKYEKLLVDALHGNLKNVKANLDFVKALRNPHLNPLQPVATIGAYRGHLLIFEFALEKGADKDIDFCRAVKLGACESSEMKAFYEKDKVWYMMAIDFPGHPSCGPPKRISTGEMMAIDESIGR